MRKLLALSLIIAIAGCSTTPDYTSNSFKPASEVKPDDLTDGYGFITYLSRHLRDYAGFSWRRADAVYVPIDELHKPHKDAVVSAVLPYLEKYCTAKNGEVVPVVADDDWEAIYVCQRGQETFGGISIRFSSDNLVNTIKPISQDRWNSIVGMKRVKGVRHAEIEKESKYRNMVLEALRNNLSPGMVIHYSDGNGHNGSARILNVNRRLSDGGTFSAVALGGGLETGRVYTGYSTNVLLPQDFR